MSHKYYVWWSTGRYEGQNLSTLDTEKDVVALLNKYAKNTEFTFCVVHGKEVNFKPVEVVQAYEKA